jgi:ribonuclease D
MGIRQWQRSHTDVYISDSEALVELVGALRKAPAVAVDTEFMRERTYYARLCLIQLASDDVCAIVDPLAFDDLSALEDLMTDRRRQDLSRDPQDLEIFFRLLNKATSPVFDTQVAATLAGFRSR